MSAFFPKLLPGELLYSAVARYRDAAKPPSERAVARSVFGSASGAAVTGLSGRLDSFLARLPPGHGLRLRDILYGHTTFPYYEKFVTAARARKARWALARSGESGVAYGLLGLRASGVKSPGRLRYCRACAARERTTFGAAYWHRTCQLPGVLVCPRHPREVLRRSAVRTGTRESVHLFASLDEALNLPAAPVEVPSGVALEALARLASGTARLLSTRAEPPGLKALRARHHRLLARRGFLTSGGNVRMARLRREIVSRYGASFLRTVGCAIGEREGGSWLGRLVRKPRTSQHPLRHLLLMTSLGFGPTTFFAGTGVRTPAKPSRASDASFPRTPCPNPLCYSPALSHRAHPEPTRCEKCGFTFRKAPGPDARLVVLDHGPVWRTELKRLVREETGGESLRSIARALGVAPKTVQRHARRLGVWRPAWTTWDTSGPAGKRRDATWRATARHRAAWKALRNAHPTAGTQRLRARKPATYAHLYRFDRAWLRSRQPPRRQPASRRGRVDWSARDRVLREKAEAVVTDILSGRGERPTRLCKTTVARRMGHLAVVLQHPNKLPKTSAYLEAITESRAAFGRRRIRHAARRFAAEGVLPPKWVFTRRAGLRADLAATLAAEVDRALRSLASDGPNWAVCTTAKESDENDPRGDDSRRDALREKDAPDATPTTR